MNYDITIVIPFLNEEDNIEYLVGELNCYISTLKDINVEVILVDDGSTDNSIELLQRQKFANYSAKLIKLSKNYGAQTADRAGILNARGKYITIMSADLQDPLELVELLYKKCLEGNEIVYTSRETIKAKISKKFFSRIYSALMRHFVFKDFPKKGFDVIMFGTKVKEQLDKNMEVNSSIMLQIITMGFKQDNISFHKKARKYGKSKWTLSKKIKLFIDSFVAFSFAPIRFVTVMGLTISLIGIAWTIYIVLRTILVNDLAPGWPALSSIIILGFGLTNISIGIIAEYLWRTLDASRNRPPYIIDEMYKLSELSEKKD